MERARENDLGAYRQKRDFDRTPEPKGHRRPKRPRAPLTFVVQKHAARRLHYDFRLELDGVLKSWAVPKGPSLVPGDRRLAVETEDHPLEYASFEGVIPKGEYGAGAVVVWDRGTWHPIGDPRTDLAKGKLTFHLEGDKLRGRFHLVRTRGRPEDKGRATWLLMKGDDDQAMAATAGSITAREPASVLTGRDIDQVAREADRVWSSAAGEEAPPAIPSPGDPAGLPAARKRRVPANVRPQLATLVTAPPEGDAWVHEIKLDGYRLLCRKDKGNVRLFTRSGQDWTARFGAIAEGVAALPADSVILDGEAVAIDERGRSNFQRLQHALSGKRAHLVLYAFDILELDGWDVRDSPLVDRKRLLRTLIARTPGGSVLKLSDHVKGHGPAFYREACRERLEGVVSKRADAPYRSARTRTWLKSKCQARQELAIVGFTDPAGSRSGFGALVLGVHDEEGSFRYCGKVGTGFDAATLVELRAELEKDEVRRPPVAGAPRARNIHWVKPRLVAEITFTEWTREGILRHPSFVGLRRDKTPADVTIESPAPSPSPPARPAAPNEIAGVRLSTPERVYWPDVGVTKRELAMYYERVAPRMLPLVAGRPLTLVRCPEGQDAECFYQKHATDALSRAVPRVSIKAKEAPYTMVRDLASIIELVQLGTLELHVWGARGDRIDRPDTLVFDLDPHEAIPFRRLRDTALVLRELLGDLGLVAFLRSTGGKGLHVVVPITRRPSWSEVKSFTQAVARMIVREAPHHYTASMSKAKRPGKIFIDYFRNDPDATAIATYSTRAREAAPIAVPLFWEELAEAEEAPFWTLRDAGRRLAEADPWADYEACRRPLTASSRRRVETD